MGSQPSPCCWKPEPFVLGRSNRFLIKTLISGGLKALHLILVLFKDHEGHQMTSIRRAGAMDLGFGFPVPSDFFSSHGFLLQSVKCEEVLAVLKETFEEP